MPFRPLGLFEAPIFPNNYQAILYATWYRNMGEPPETWRKAFIRFPYSETIEVLTTWGVNEIFFVIAYPPFGITIHDTDDVILFNMFEGWILDYSIVHETFIIRYKAGEIGLDQWKEKRLEIKNNA
jgi:hypothetical protein